MTKPGLAARRAAVDLLDAITGERRLLSELLPEAVEALPAEERARAQRLAANCLRWMDRADRVLGPYLRRRPHLTGHNILRLAVVELAVDRSAAHGVVDAAVELCRNSPDTKRMSGLVNAVLRKVAVDLDRWDSLPMPRLPKWLRKPLLTAYGKTAVEAMEMAHAAGAPLDITSKPGTDWAAKLGGSVLPTGSLRLQEAGQVSALPGYAEGGWWVQDAAAALPARILAVQPGERVLDMCAAPGGKALQLAAAGARVTALDISEARMERVRENLARTGLAADLVIADALEWRPQQPFDAILLDAPCSATGTIRRHPDLPHAKDLGGLPELTALQAALLDRAAGMLRPGGRLVYCTCSLLPEEGEAQVTAVIERRPKLALDRAALTLPGIEPHWQVPEGLRLRPDYWPERGGMDGFFIAAMRKAA
ncbi:MAG: RsmB/NOP family class I SAM-dependent RNA methyltransferase [Rhodobacter sp.]|nr:RsmB/NOP family class I SAM-dependent RNA methyltransferase [Rhodobacter sp.]